MLEPAGVSDDIRMRRGGGQDSAAGSLATLPNRVPTFYGDQSDHQLPFDLLTDFVHSIGISHAFSLCSTFFVFPSEVEVAHAVAEESRPAEDSRPSSAISCLASGAGAQLASSEEHTHPGYYTRSLDYCYTDSDYRD